jgi:GAF domain-containing protein
MAHQIPPHSNLRVDDAFIRNASDHVCQMLEAGVPRAEILTRLANAAESLAGPGSVVSILVLDEEGLLRNGASPNLPSDYLTAIDRLKPNASLGTCASAAATGLMVVTRDFYADDKWAELRHLPIALGFAGAWSMPIKSTDGRVLGTFGTYFRQPRGPTPAELNGVTLLARAAAIALDVPTAQELCNSAATLP